MILQKGLALGKDRDCREAAPLSVCRLKILKEAGKRPDKNFQRKKGKTEGEHNQESEININLNTVCG